MNVATNEDMNMHVSVRELKNHLSKYLHQMQTGKVIIITSHHVPIAKLIPIVLSSDKAVTQILKLEGVSWNGKKPKGAEHPPKMEGIDISDYVLEERR